MKKRIRRFWYVTCSYKASVGMYHFPYYSCLGIFGTAIPTSPSNFKQTFLTLVTITLDTILIHHIMILSP